MVYIFIHSPLPSYFMCIYIYIYREREKSKMHVDVLIYYREIIICDKVFFCNIWNSVNDSSKLIL